ncbi:MAG TPA: YgcG family protein, partial [Telluria sp.]
MRLLWALFLATLLHGVQAQDLVPVPALATRVTDQAGMLSAEQRTRLETVLADYETKTGSQ